MFDDIPEECKHRCGRITKNGCKIRCSLCDYIVDHDECVSSSGCDAIVVIKREKKCIIVEAKGGRVESLEEAEDIVRQIQECLDYYDKNLTGFDVKCVFLKGKRLDDFARQYIDDGPHRLKGTIIKRSCGDDLIGVFISKKKKANRNKKRGSLNK